MEYCNQAHLGYFNVYFNEKVYGPGEVVLVGKDIYY